MSKFNKNHEKKMLNIFESIDNSKNALKVYLIYATNAPDLNKYKMEILTSNEVNESLDFLPYIAMPNADFFIAASSDISLIVSLIKFLNSVVFIILYLFSFTSIGFFLFTTCSFNLPLTYFNCSTRQVS